MILHYLTYLRCQCVGWGMPCCQWIEINCEFMCIILFVVTWIALNNVIFKIYLLVCWKQLKIIFFCSFVSPAAFWCCCFIFSISRDVSKKIFSVKAEESPLFLRRTSISFLNHHNHLQEWSHSLLQVMFNSFLNLPFNIRMSAWEKVQLDLLKAFEVFITFVILVWYFGLVAFQILRLIF